MFQNYFNQQVQVSSNEQLPKQQLSRSQELGQKYFNFDSSKFLWDMAKLLDAPTVDSDVEYTPALLMDTVVIDNKTIHFTIKLHPAIVQMFGMMFQPDVDFSCVKDGYGFSMKPIKNNPSFESVPNNRTSFGDDGYIGLPRHRSNYPAFNSGFNQNLWIFEVKNLKTKESDQTPQA